jgi:hypothetical protein
MRGPQSNTARCGEVPITIEDIAHFDEIAAAAQTISTVTTERGLPALEFWNLGRERMAM